MNAFDALAGPDLRSLDPIRDLALQTEQKRTLTLQQGRIELLHGEELRIKTSTYPGTQALMVMVERIAEGL